VPGDRALVVASVALLAGLAAVGLQVSGAMRAVREAPDGEEDDSDLIDRESLENRLQDAERRLEAAEKRARELEERLGKAERDAAGAAESAAGALKLLRETGTGIAAAGGAGGSAPPDERAAELESLLAAVREGRVPRGGVYAHFQKIRELGGLDRAIAEMEKYAAAHADEAGPQVDLALAYVTKLLEVPDGPQRGLWSSKSMAACDAALKIDPEHWDAQFTKSMNLSQWPAFLGRQPEAIRGFEKLVEQQERSPSEPRFAQTYYLLGNTYRAAGNTEKARDAFRRGLERFPEDKQLREQLELLEKR
jgi:tetratricopeptide (TPR) repeat protein